MDCNVSLKKKINENPPLAEKEADLRRGSCVCMSQVHPLEMERVPPQTKTVTEAGYEESAGDIQNVMLFGKEGREGNEYDNEQPVPLVFWIYPAVKESEDGCDVDVRAGEGGIIAVQPLYEEQGLRKKIVPRQIGVNDICGE